MIAYRQAAAADIPELVRLRIEFLSDIQKDVERRDAAALRDALLDFFTRGMQSGSYIAWLAVDDGNIVATSGLCFLAMPPTFRNPTGRAAYIMNMYTLPSYRRRGIGAALFGKLIDEAQRLGYKKLSLHATAMGRTLYERYGFKDEKKEMVLRLP
jgi:GNAT superfamily N-acetyltransferase